MRWQSPPEIPPWRPAPTPERPERPAPAPSAPVPHVFVDDVADDVTARLRRDRRLLVRGRLAERVVTRVCAELMLLDGVSSDPVELVINSSGGPVEEVSALLDVIELMRAPVATRVIGDAAGTAAVVLVVGTGGRSATAHARIDLRLDVSHRIDGRVADIARDAAALDAAVRRLAERVAARSRLDVDAVRRAFADGRPMTAEQAEGDDLIDEVARPPRRPSPPTELRPGRR